ncbi:hypothetical protein V3N99_09670 [Dermatophilaceae bacterium Soc4.6]
MSDPHGQSPVSALLMLEGLAWALEQLAAPAPSRERRLRAHLASDARDAARAVIDQHEEWSVEQLLRARACSGGEWGREILRALSGADGVDGRLRHPSTHWTSWSVVTPD